MRGRRDFLKLLAAATGGLILGGCDGADGGDNGGSATGPNAYRFFALTSTGDRLPDGRTVQDLPGGVFINDANQILFYAMTAAGMGLYQVIPDFTAGAKLVTDKVVAVGDTLADGSIVLGLGTAVSNASGRHTLLVRTNQNSRLLCAVAADGSLETVAGFRTEVPVLGGLRLGGVFGDLAINERGDLLVVDHFTRPGQTAPAQGLFLFPNGRVDSSAKLLSSTADLIPASQIPITGFGLLDLDSLGSYVAHVSGTTALATPDSVPQGLIVGQTSGGQANLLLTAPPGFQVGSSGKDSSYIEGSSIFGARLADDTGKVAHLVHQSQTQMVMLLDGQPVSAVGSRSPGGSTVRGFSGPVLQANGLLFTVEITDDGHELVQLGPSVSQLLLSRGDRVGQRTLESIIFGLHSDQVSRQGRLVLVGEFTDGSSAVVLGLPV